MDTVKSDEDGVSLQLLHVHHRKIFCSFALHTGGFWRVQVDCFEQHSLLRSATGGRDPRTINVEGMNTYTTHIPFLDSDTDSWQELVLMNNRLKETQ